MFRDWEWIDTWGLLLVAALIAVGSFAVYGSLQDHTVQFYYMSDHGSGNGHNGYCIDGYRNWYANDTGVFCSDDIQKTVGVLKQLNDALALRKGR